MRKLHLLGDMKEEIRSVLGTWCGLRQTGDDFISSFTSILWALIKANRVRSVFIKYVLYPRSCHSPDRWMDGPTKEEVSCLSSWPMT